MWFAGLREQFTEREARLSFRRVGGGRLLATALFLCIALGFARYGWKIPLVGDAERALYDIRAIETGPRVAQDPRIVLVTYTDQTLANTGKRSPLDRDLLARALTTLDAMHPKAIGIDILIDQAQPEDAQLVAAFRAMHTPTYLAYASSDDTSEFVATWQDDFEHEFQKRLQPGVVRPTSIRLEDDKGVIRSWPTQPADLPPLLATMFSPDGPAFRDYTGGIVFRQPVTTDRPVFSELPIDLFGNAAVADMLRPQVDGRIVLIGGNLADFDRLDTTLTRLTGHTMMGLEVHAHLLAQALDGARLTPIPGWALWVAAIAVIAAGALTSLLDLRSWVMTLVFVLQLMFFVGLPFAIQATVRIDSLALPAAGWLVGWFLAFAATGAAARGVGSEQRRFAQAALGKYLPRDIAELILRDPDQLALHGEKRQIYALFTDLEGFTRLCDTLSAERVATTLNAYLEALSETVLAHGGTIDKFVGDALVAFWGAPIARDDDAERAAKAALALQVTGRAVAASGIAGEGVLGRTRIGLHHGEAIVGNFGGEGRIQYTALGDAMNTASRLEAANKQLGTSILFSAQAAATAPGPFRPLGRVKLRGRTAPVEIFEPVAEADRAAADELAALYHSFDAGDAAVIVALENFAAAHPDDAALRNLVYRLHRAGPGGTYVLD